MLLALVLLVVFVLAPLGRYGGRYPAAWSPLYGWLPALLIIIVLLWLLQRGASLL